MNGSNSDQRQVQTQFQLQLKSLDDVFHNVIIALERLERYLDLSTGYGHPAKITGVGTDRDLHDDSAIPPTLALLHGELATQCLALFYQTKFDKQEPRFRAVHKHFIGDLLEWYGGRNSRGLVGDDVDKYSLPVLAALDRFVDAAPKISAIVEQYIAKLDDLSTFSDQEKERGVREGFIAWIKGTHITGQRMKAFVEARRPDEEIQLTPHIRGSKEDGLRRLANAYISVFQDKAPLRRLLDSVLPIFPELASVGTGILIDAIYSRPLAPKI